MLGDYFILPHPVVEHLLNERWYLPPQFILNLTVKQYVNRSTFAEVIVKIKVTYFSQKHNVEINVVHID